MSESNKPVLVVSVRIKCRQLEGVFEEFSLRKVQFCFGDLRALAWFLLIYSAFASDCPFVLCTGPGCSQHNMLLSTVGLGRAIRLQKESGKESRRDIAVGKQWCSSTFRSSCSAKI